MFRCRHVCSNGVECMSECEDHVEPDPDPEDLVEQRLMSGAEMDRVANEYFDHREVMLERGRL